MYPTKVNSLLLDYETSQNAFEALINFFKDIKNKLVPNYNHKYKKNIAKNTSEDDLESHKNIIISNLDMLIAISKKSEYEPISKESYILIHLKDMFTHVLFEKYVSEEEINLLTEILFLYEKSMQKRKRILNSKNITDKDKINKYLTEFEDFSNKFSDKEMDFYSLIDADEETYKKTIYSTYSLLGEID